MEPSKPPLISIVVPVRNEAMYIDECLRQLLHQNYPKDKMEILIIDGMSTDGTKKIVLESEITNRKLGVNIRLLDNSKGQRASALNIGIRNAKGNVIVRIDARTRIPPDYIEKCMKTLIETAADNIGGVQKPITLLENEDLTRNEVNPRNSRLTPQLLTQAAIGIALIHPFGVGDAQFRLGEKSGYADTVYLGCFKKEIFDKVGLFDEESPVLSEDADMNYRIRKAGGKVYLNKDIIAYYYPRDNLKDLWKLYFRYGGARAGNLLKHTTLAWRQFIPPTFLSSLVLIPVLGVFNKLFFYLWFLIVGSYITTDFLVSLHLTSKYKTSNLHYKLSLLPRVFLAFPIMHFAWASGFWRRLLQRPKPGQYWGY